MFGAICGDIIGSRFEFDKGPFTKEFELFNWNSCYTDDTVMTIAVAEALLDSGINADVDIIKKNVVEAMCRWAEMYPRAGYGYRFYKFLFFDDLHRPYNSWGNGSAMRVSAAGWLYETVERTREVARWTAEVSHNHPEGVKGAECTAAVIFLARKGKSKEEIKEYVIKEFGYDLSENLELLRLRHEHIESCMDSLPKALTSFFEGCDYEDTVRNAVSLGGDTDTIAAISGSMAEAMFGVPKLILEKGKDCLDIQMYDMVNRFSQYIENTFN